MSEPQDPTTSTESDRTQEVGYTSHAVPSFTPQWTTAGERVPESTSTSTFSVHGGDESTEQSGSTAFMAPVGAGQSHIQYDRSTGSHSGQRLDDCMFWIDRNSTPIWTVGETLCLGSCVTASVLFASQG
uniref:Uncharacterized protein n=1 Tax=Kwoniella dejecticola CBS 10117 TaxID=1296121 RepID=A0A1A5ZYX1_9TREE|nr:uncharacterized protein I303_06567 [Kwoniella dejecticola CBS 10117]OBR83008.1 hypothetical protein I303_06567 [Kwoniella dejecticola CBS 10117]